MFIRQKFRTKNGKRHAYWALVESYRTERGPRQRVVSWLGKLDEEGRLGVGQLASETKFPFVSDPIKGQVQLSLLEEPKPRYVKVNAKAVRVENCRQFGAPWIALKLIEKLNLKSLFDRLIPAGREAVPWSSTVLLLLIARFCEPSSELYIAEQWLPKTALPTLLGVPQERVDDNRLYRGLDQLLPHKDAIEMHLKERLGELFEIEFDLLLYDVTSTFFEGQAAANPKAQRGYSRDKRSDCKQVCIGLVVTRCGMPLGYKVFSGNTADVTTVEEIVETMESRYGTAGRLWVMDRGMVSEDNIQFLRDGGRRYIIGTPKSMLRKFEAELLKKDWNSVRDGLEVKLCRRDDLGKGELFVVCRSADRRRKDEAILRRSEEKIETRLKTMTTRCTKQKRDVQKVEREIGKLLGQNTRASRLFEVQVKERDSGGAEIIWSKVKNNTDWATLSAGCYLLRTNVQDWSDEELWKAYTQLSEAEAAFRIHKTDLQLRPIWHQKEDRVDAHLLVCFLSYVMWKTLGGFCEQAGLGSEPRRVVDELSEIRSMDVVLPTQEGIEIRQACIAHPSEHQTILLERLGLDLPKRIRQTEM
ncbi:Transposase DDE domain protein [Stieleria maiorica]|uniref:Transposase DDE domain protein n=1 Tax=Stieleria maiorica TaxID=2795974 RepID=A0A5B9MG83_9BACT|nr:IS1634 family transposase [Stieleria maiorica]QEG00179.1 Transposase DDE domain protein [Stieleria maiorica]